MNLMNFLKPLKTLDDVSQARLDFHIHTDWTDGADSIQGMYDKACSINLEAILYSEHVRASSGSWYPDFAREVKSLPSRPCRAFVGAETKILNFSGDLDCPSEVFEHADAIMGVVHRFPGETDAALSSRDKSLSSEAIDIEFELSKTIMRTGKVHILGHPMGMSLRRFGLKPDQSVFEELAVVAAETGVCFEINSRYHDNPLELINICTRFGAPISLGSNAHSCEEVGEIMKVIGLNG
jgi:histidinol phosphatase-like PHP family hydrolase